MTERRGPRFGGVRVVVAMPLRGRSSTRACLNGSGFRRLPVAPTDEAGPRYCGSATLARGTRGVQPVKMIFVSFAPAIGLRLRCALAFLAVSTAGCGDGGSGPNAGSDARPVAVERTVTADAPPPTPVVRLTVRRPPRVVSGDDLLVAGVVTRGSRVTVRGRPAGVQRGRFRTRLKLRVGVNRFTIVARRAGHQTTRRRIRVRRKPPPPPPPPPVAQVPAAPVAPASCPPHFTPAPGGCAPADNQAYEGLPKGDAYGDQIPEVPGIQGE